MFAIAPLSGSISGCMNAKPSAALFLVAACLLVAGCNFDFPLTATPTHKVEPRLLGDWVGVEKDQPNDESMHVRQFDDTTYVVAIDKDIYRVFHSDLAGTAFVSAQDLNSADRKYVYYTWQLSPDGDHLTLRAISTKVIPEETKDRAAMQKLVDANLANPKLLAEPVKFVRMKPHSP